MTNVPVSSAVALAAQPGSTLGPAPAGVAVLDVFAYTLAALLVGAAVLHLIPKLGAPGQRIAAWLCGGLPLDLVITYFTAAPWFAGWFLAGWWGVLVSVGAQIAAVMIWTVVHEQTHRKHLRGPRIVHSLNRTVGRVRNHTAVWWTAWAVPIFWVIRVAEWFVYPPLIWLVRFPRYDQREWVNVSRQKFEGLIGHDLIWCLYCDWMTGVWSLGSEMLRNVESFWCPIRYHSDKKCANCQIDFPDIAGTPGMPDSAWVGHDRTIADAAALVDRKYPPGQKVNAWFGHPARLTVEGRDHKPSGGE